MLLIYFQENQLIRVICCRIRL